MTSSWSLILQRVHFILIFRLNIAGWLTHCIHSSSVQHTCRNYHGRNNNFTYNKNCTNTPAIFTEKKSNKSRNIRYFTKPFHKYNTSLFAEYNQQDTTFRNLFISVWRSTCFRRFFRPSSGAQNCTYSVRYLLDQYCYLLLVRLKHVQRLTKINKLWNVAYCWLYSANILAMHGPMNVK